MKKLLLMLALSVTTVHAAGPGREEVLAAMKRATRS